MTPNIVAFDGSQAPFLRVGTVGDLNLPVNISLHSFVDGGCPDPVWVTLLNDYRLENPVGYPARMIGSAALGGSLLPAWSYVPLPLPEAAALIDMGAAIDWQLEDGQRIYGRKQPSTGLFKPYVKATDESGSDLYYVLPKSKG